MDKALAEGVMARDGSGSNSGCGCFEFVASLLVVVAILFGLPTPWGELHIDLLPPAIRLEAQ